MMNGLAQFQIQNVWKVFLEMNATTRFQSDLCDVIRSRDIWDSIMIMVLVLVVGGGGGGGVVGGGCDAASADHFGINELLVQQELFYFGVRFLRLGGS
jgi:hypothetical protein